MFVIRTPLASQQSRIRSCPLLPSQDMFGITCQFHQLSILLSFYHPSSFHLHSAACQMAMGSQSSCPSALFTGRGKFNINIPRVCKAACQIAAAPLQRQICVLGKALRGCKQNSRESLFLPLPSTC